MKYQDRRYFEPAIFLPCGVISVLLFSIGVPWSVANITVYNCVPFFVFFKLFIINKNYIIFYKLICCHSV
jgi:hypothetical protein